MGDNDGDQVFRVPSRRRRRNSERMVRDLSEREHTSRRTATVKGSTAPQLLLEARVKKRTGRRREGRASRSTAASAWLGEKTEIEIVVQGHMLWVTPRTDANAVREAPQTVTHDYSLQTRRARRGREQDFVGIGRRMYEEIRSSRGTQGTMWKTARVLFQLLTCSIYKSRPPRRALHKDRMGGDLFLFTHLQEEVCVLFIYSYTPAAVQRRALTHSTAYTELRWQGKGKWRGLAAGRTERRPELRQTCAVV